MSRTRNGPSEGSRSATAPAIDSRPSSVPERSSGTSPLRLAGRLQELGAVVGVARRGGGGQPAAADAQAIHHLPELASTARHRSTASGASRPVESTPCPSRVIRIRRSSGRPARPSPGAWSSSSRSRWRRWPAGCPPPLLPRAPYHDTLGHGRLTACGGQAGWSPIRRAVHSPTGSSAPVSHQARWACRHLTPWRVPPTPPVGRGPVWAGSIRASRSAAYAAWAAAIRSAGPRPRPARRRLSIRAG